MFLFSSTDAPASNRVESAIRNASTATGAGFDYLLNTAVRESSLNPTARSGSSSATGLYQFIDSTWLQMVKEAGPELGLKAYADSIQRSANGRYTIADPDMRRQVLALRNDPQVSALMAGAFARKNSDYLSDALGRTPTDGELYIAHFMGPAGAASLIRLAAANGSGNAAAAFPQQAAANPAIFYAKGGQALSLSDVYAKLVQRFDDSSGPAATATAAADEKLSANPQTWLAIPARNAYAAEMAGDAEAAPFHALFRTDASSPISNYVAATWSNLGAANAAVAAVRTPAQAHESAQAEQPAEAQPAPVQPVQTRLDRAADAVVPPLQVPLPPARPAAAGQGGGERGARPAGDGGFFSGVGSFLSDLFATSNATPRVLGERRSG